MYHSSHQVGQTWTNFCFEIPTDADTRGKSSTQTALKSMGILGFCDISQERLGRVECGTPPTFPLVPLAFGYLSLTRVYTFFWWRLCTLSWEIVPLSMQDRLPPHTVLDTFYALPGSQRSLGPLIPASVHLSWRTCLTQ